jgi:hypothetical protein
MKPESISDVTGGCPGVPCSSFCHHAERCSLTGNGICDAIRDASADGLICWLEKRGYGWSLDHTGRLIEARIWDWPNVIGRYRPNTVEPLADMLRGAMRTMTREQLCKTNVHVVARAEQPTNTESE